MNNTERPADRKISSSASQFKKVLQALANGDLPYSDVESHLQRLLGSGASAEELQGIIYDVGRAIPRYQDPNAKGATPDKPGVSNAWFGTIYQVLLGEERGPRFGSFVGLYGIDNTRKLIDKALKGELAPS